MRNPLFTFGRNGCSRSPEYAEKLKELDEAGRIWWGPTGEARPSIKRYLSEVSDLVPRTIWKKEDVGSNRTSKNEMRALFPAEASFGTPKPEGLIERILNIATRPGDLVLDSFLGSGTTAAAAHKTGRRYIGIEMGEHALTHCLPRLQKVIHGEQGGISKSAGWTGGGGVRFLRVGEPVFGQDGEIHPSVSFSSLAAHLWHFETGEPALERFDSPFLGESAGRGYYLLYKGMGGDSEPGSGNVLSNATLQFLERKYPHAGPRIIYAETTRLSEVRLRQAGITFKQIPYDIRAG